MPVVVPRNKLELYAKSVSTSLQIVTGVKKAGSIGFIKSIGCNKFPSIIYKWLFTKLNFVMEPANPLELLLVSLTNTPVLLMVMQEGQFNH